MSDEMPAGYELVWRLPRQLVQHRAEFDTREAAENYLDTHIKPIAKEWDLFANGVLINNGWYER